MQAMESEQSTAYFYLEGRWVPSALVLQQTRLIIKNIEPSSTEKEKELLRIDLRDVVVPPPTARPITEQSTPLYRVSLNGVDHSHVLGFSTQSDAEIWRKMLFSCTYISRKKVDKILINFFNELKRFEAKAKLNKSELALEILSFLNTIPEEMESSIKREVQSTPNLIKSIIVPKAVPSTPNTTTKSTTTTSLLMGSQGRTNTIEEREKISPRFEENEAAVIRAQNYVRRWLWRRSVGHTKGDSNISPSAQAKQRDNLVAELIISEQEYVDRMRELFLKCMIPLYDTGVQKLLKDAKFDFTLHDKLQAVVFASSELLRSLKISQNVGVSFTERITQLTEAYTDYTQTYVKDLERLLIRRKKNSSLRKYLKGMEEEEGNLLPTLLLAPILRMKTYEWTLKQLVLFTPESHEDHSFLTSTCSAIERVNAMNEMNRENAEKFEKFSLILHMKSPSTDVQGATRDWVREGPVQMILMSGPHRCYIHLFSDCIAVARMSHKNNQFDKLIQLSNATVIEGQDTEYIKNTFVVKRKSETHVFGTATKGERSSWIKDIEVVIQEGPKSPRPRRSSSGKGKSPIIQNCVADLPTQLPKLPIETIEKETLFAYHGPDNDSTCVYKPNSSDRFSYRTISTYPTLGGKRDGDPIADHFSISVKSNCVFLCIADGCNWGYKAREAAIKATTSFTDYMNSSSKELKNLQEIAHHLLSSANNAHNNIIRGYESDIWSAGTTTLLGGVICKLKNDNYGIVFLNIGDCKAFRYSKKDGSVTDFTSANRGNVSDATDPGGRIGPYVGKGAPDLRNLKLYYYTLDEGDLIFVCSDGVHDNFDPQQLGKTPKELDKELDTEDWSELEGKEKASKVKSEFRCKLMQDILLEQQNKGKVITPQVLVDAFIEYCENVTKICREYMIANPGLKQPPDYKNYPGKLDHTTLVCLRIGKFDI